MFLKAASIFCIVTFLSSYFGQKKWPFILPPILKKRLFCPSPSSLFSLSCAYHGHKWSLPFVITRTWTCVRVFHTILFYGNATHRWAFDTHEKTRVLHSIFFSCERISDSLTAVTRASKWFFSLNKNGLFGRRIHAAVASPAKEGAPGKGQSHDGDH